VVEQVGIDNGPVALARAIERAGARGSPPDTVCALLQRLTH
jgi:hypothetical protein